MHPNTDTDPAKESPTLTLPSTRKAYELWLERRPTPKPFGLVPAVFILTTAFMFGIMASLAVSNLPGWIDWAFVASLYLLLLGLGMELFKRYVTPTLWYVRVQWYALLVSVAIYFLWLVLTSL